MVNLTTAARSATGAAPAPSQRGGDVVAHFAAWDLHTGPPTELRDILPDLERFNSAGWLRAEVLDG